MAEGKEPTWSVTGQVEDFGADDTGTYVTGVRVSFRTASGATGSVFIPGHQYTVDQVRALVGQRAAAAEAVQNLSG
jgi:hypothetical protein